MTGFAPNASRPAGRRATVLFLVTTSDVGGTETVVRELATRLDRSELKPIVCSLRPGGRVLRELA